MSITTADEPPVRARIPADLNAPDRVVAGLTARQVAILAVAAIPVYLAWQQFADRIPVPVLAGVTAPIAAVVVGLALGRRDGLGMDTWLLAALAHRRRPRRLLPGPVHPRPTPEWAPDAIPVVSAQDGGRLGVLRLPASAVAPDGTISTGSGTAVALMAATTVTDGLHTNAEQAGLVAGYARWLNGLSGPVQLVVSARRVDLGFRAVRVAEQADRLPHPALAAAAVDYAEFLLDLTEQADPLERTITIACIGTARDVRRRAVGAAEALSAVGSRCTVLDAAEVTAVLTAATDPFSPGTTLATRTPPQVPVRLTQQWATLAVEPWDDDDPGFVSDAEHPYAGATDDRLGGEPLLSEPWDDAHATVPANCRGRWIR
jgi:hypothetical protein